MTWGDLLKAYKKPDSVLVGPVSRMLAVQPPWVGRAKQVVHPSELTYDDCCPRAIGLRILTGQVREGSIDLIRSSIFDEGHEYHRKWQAWAWKTGKLFGEYECLRCDNLWLEVSPDLCVRCGATKKYLRYREVPVRDEERNISGRGDGILTDAEDVDTVYTDPSTYFLEVKSVGDGTIRMDDPALLMKHTHKLGDRTVVDYYGLWRDLSSPLLSHIKQVNLYGAILGVTKAVILYEYKMGGQQPKEFVITLDPSMVQAELDLAQAITDAASQGALLDCPHGGCKKCEAYDEGGEDVRVGAGAGHAGGGGADPSADTQARPARPARRRDGADRRGADAAVPRDGAVGELLGGKAGRRRTGGQDRGEVPGAGEGTGVRYSRRRQRD